MKINILFLILILSFFFAEGQTPLKGKVIDGIYKRGLQGAHILIEDSNNGTVSDQNGQFQLSILEWQKDKRLLISYPGYETFKMPIPKNDSIEIALFPWVESVDTVITFDPETYEEQIMVVRSDGAGIQNSNKLQNIGGAIPKEQIHFGNYTEDYSPIFENDDQSTIANPLSTFSIDVDKASYSNVRRFLNEGSLPPVDAVRVEELVNYFNYNYPNPSNNHPFSINTELTQCPWNKERQLLHIGLKGKDLDNKNLPPSNLVFLLDVSGSMSAHNKLPLLKSAFEMLVQNLTENDKIAIVVYAGAAGVVLPATAGSEQETILQALNKLNAGGSTAGGAGIKLAYKIAKENYLPNGNNRIILATDGDFNVGVSSDGSLTRLIEEKRNDNIFLSVLGFGMGNYKDNKLELLADKGNGNYAYIDNLMEAKKTLVNDLRGTLFTIAKDVKIQIEFNPHLVESYRLVGYENRLLDEEDFNNDQKDAGELGAGHTVTAIYEIVPKKSSNAATSLLADPLKYQNHQLTKVATKGKEIAAIKFRYKTPKGKESKLITQAIPNKIKAIKKTSKNVQFSTAVAGFGLLLRNSKYNQSFNFQSVLELASLGKGKDKNEYRKEFIKLVDLAKELKM